MLGSDKRLWARPELGSLAGNFACSCICSCCPVQRVKLRPLHGHARACW